MGSSHGKTAGPEIAGKRLKQHLAILHNGDGEERKAAWGPVQSVGHALREADKLQMEVKSNVKAEHGKEEPSGGGIVASLAAMAIPEKLQKTAGNEKAMPTVHIYARCEGLEPHKGRPVTSMAVVYSKLFHEEEWTEIDKSEIISKDGNPNFEKRFNIPFCAEVVRMVRFEIYRIKREEEYNYLSRQHFIGGFECRLMQLISTGSVEGGWVVRDLIGCNTESVGRLIVWAEEEHAGKSLVMFNLSAYNLSYSDVWKHTTDAYFVLHRAEPVSDDPRDRVSTVNVKNANVWQTTASRENTRPPRLARKRPTIGKEAVDNAALGTMSEFAVWRSEVVRRNTSPTWKRVEDVQAQELCDGDLKRPILIEVWDWFRISAPRIIGKAETCFEDMHMAYWKQKPLSLQLTRKVSSRCSCCSSGGSSKVVPSGSLKMEKIILEKRFTFLDFIRGGLEIVPLIAVDMTRGNLDPDNPKSLHRHGGDKLNDYATSIKAVCEVFQSYQGPEPSDAYPLYGFGAKVPPARARCSHCFALTGDFLLPHCLGISGALDAYHQSLGVVDFHGPTRFTEVLGMAAKWAKPFWELQKAEGPAAISQQKYFVVVILTKGNLEDEQATVKAITQYVGLPLSIAIIGIGSEGHSFLECLGEEVKAWQQLSLQVCCRMGHVCQQVAQSLHHRSSVTCDECGAKVSTCKTRWDCEDCGTSFCEKCGIWVAQRMAKEPVYRDMVSFTKFNDFVDDPRGLAAAAFAKVPEQMLAYYKLADAKPRHLSKFETEQGLPLKRNNVPVPKRGDGKKQPEKRSSSERGSNDEGSLLEIDLPMEGLSEFARAEIVREVDEKKILQSLCPLFLAERRVEMQDAGKELGYLKEQVKRALDDGIAENSMEMLVEAVVYGHQSDMASYKEALRNVREKAYKKAARDASRSASKRQRHISYRQCLESTEDGQRLPALPRLKDAPDLQDNFKEITSQYTELRSSAADTISQIPSCEQLFVSRQPRAMASCETVHDDGRLDVIDLTDEHDFSGALCTICYEKPINLELLPCHHKVACDTCISKGGDCCPMCRKSITGRVILK